MREGFSITSEYHFYLDKEGTQKYSSSRSRNLNAKITLRNRIAIIIDMIDLVWSLK